MTKAGYYFESELVSGSKGIYNKFMGYIYIIGNAKPVLYVGVTSDLNKRIWEHKNKIIKGFSYKYNLNKLLFFEEFPTIIQAIEMEKKIKNWHRDWKLNLIKQSNPTFEDLAKGWY